MSETDHFAIFKKCHSPPQTRPTYTNHAASADTPFSALDDALLPYLQDAAEGSAMDGERSERRIRNVRRWMGNPCHLRGVQRHRKVRPIYSGGVVTREASLFFFNSWL
jgi:hypothetical protein